MRCALIAILVTATGFVAAADFTAEQIKSVTGGTPIPAAVHNLVIPAVAKQNISFKSPADEVILGTVSFAGDAPVGTLTLDGAAGKGTGKISIPVEGLSTGNDMRNGHLRSDKWLDAAKFPTISFTDVTFTKLADTAWSVSGTWTMHGVSKPLTALANIKLIPTVPHLGENVVRISAKFDIDLKDFGVENPAIGTPTVTQVWNVEINLLAIAAK